MGLSAPVLDEVNVAGGAVGTDVAVARLVAVAFDTATSVVAVTQLTVRTLQLGTSVVCCLRQKLPFQRWFV